uniref:Uncharacterized protein LOC111136344 isoform X2 n=1 Tax=Crassostrea virginica TaxID=6565 RepID=A0A8B8ESY5_CRAVI|nr:uncharacterized protein LOC111136344 isoform X2 [Crassostrea virginica]
MAITFHTCFSLLLLFFTLLEFGACDNRFKSVKFCPANAQEWENRAKNKSCQEPTPDYMCAAIENHPEMFGEICTIVGLSSTGQCAVLDADTYNLNYIDCSAWPGCPSNPYRASDVYKYPVCYNITFSLSTTPPSLNVTVIQNTTSKLNEAAVTIVTLTFVLSLVVLITWSLFMWRKQSGCKKDASYPQKVSILGTYLKYRLIAICDFTELRNKMCLHSKFLQNRAAKDHFDKVMNMHSENDLKMLDLNMVYNLLVNFCDIPDLPNGWGNIPDIDDVSQGADIERIKMIVNDYFDGYYCKHANADEIIKRWTEDYGEIPLCDVINLNQESKINYLEMKPDCNVKNGVVVTSAIEHILKKMELTNIAICKGAIGCGKTTALDYVTKVFKDEGWQIECMDEFIDESCIDRALKSNKTILYCDNYCGSFGCQMFSQEVLARNERTIEAILSSEREIRVLIGIHNHVYDEINSTISHRCFLQHTNSLVDLDSLSESELLWIYKTQEEKGTTKQETKSYEDLLAITKRRSGLVGIPFQTMMMHALPDIFFSKAFCNDPFQIITEHFKMLSRQDKRKFDSFLYIMCAMIFNQNADKLDERVASAISNDLNIHWVRYDIQQLASFVKVEDDCVELKHELIAIAVFHTFLEVFRNPWSIFNACDIRKTLELIRPQDEYKKYNSFAVPLSRVSFESIRLTLETRISDANMNTEGHPLMKYFNKKDVRKDDSVIE